MKMFKFLLPLLLVSSVSSFSLKSLFSIEDKVEDVAVVKKGTKMRKRPNQLLLKLRRMKRKMKN